MSKRDIAKALAIQYELSDELSVALVDSVFDIVLEKAVKGERVVISNFGTFYVRTLNANNLRNVQTGAPVQAGPIQVLRLKVAGRAHRIVNGKATGGIRKLTPGRVGQ